MATSEKTFVTCTIKYLDKTLHTQQIDHLPALDSWLAMPAPISDFERQALLHYQQVLEFNFRDWFEGELDSHFIGPIFALVNFSTPRSNHFEERELSAVVDGIRLFGRPDGVVASGRREPEIPYFAFQEYKRNLDPNGDPAGQCLAAMLAAHELNNDALPLYGCYVVGSVWQFLVLEGRQYSISSDYSARTDALFDIFRILKALRQLVAERVAGIVTT